MKKFVVLALSAALLLPFLSVQGAVVKKVKSVCPALKSGDMIKISGKATAYTLNADKQVMGFANADALKTWVTAKTKYIYVSQKCFKTLPKPPADEPQKIGFRPGSAVLKVRGDNGNKLFVVEPNNTLAEITPAAAKILYGKKFVAKIISPKDFDNYTNRGADITEAIPHPGMVIKVEKKNYFVDENSVLRELTAKALSANNIAATIIRAVPAAVVENLEHGERVAQRMEELASPSQDIRREESSAEISGESHNAAASQANRVQPGDNIRADAGAAMDNGAGVAGAGVVGGGGGPAGASAPAADVQPVVNQQPAANPQAPAQENNQNPPIAPPVAPPVAPPAPAQANTVAIAKSNYSDVSTEPQAGAKMGEFAITNNYSATFTLNWLDLTVEYRGAFQQSDLTNIRFRLTKSDGSITDIRYSRNTLTAGPGVNSFDVYTGFGSLYLIQPGETITAQLIGDIGSGAVDGDAIADTFNSRLALFGVANNAEVAISSAPGQTITATAPRVANDSLRLTKSSYADQTIFAPQNNYKVAEYTLNNTSNEPILLSEINFSLTVPGILNPHDISLSSYNIRNNRTGQSISGDINFGPLAGGLTLIGLKNLRDGVFQLAANDTATIIINLNIPRGSLETSADMSGEYIISSNLLVKGLANSITQISSASVSGQNITAKGRMRVYNVLTGYNETHRAAVPQYDLKIGQFRIKNNIPNSPISIRTVRVAIRLGGDVQINELSNVYAVLAKNGAAVSQNIKTTLIQDANSLSFYNSGALNFVYSVAANDEVDVEIYADIAASAANSDAILDAVRPILAVQAASVNPAWNYSFSEVWGSWVGFTRSGGITAQDNLANDGIFVPADSSNLMSIALLNNQNQDIRINILRVFGDATGAVDTADFSVNSLGITEGGSRLGGFVYDFQWTNSPIANSRMEFSTPVNAQTLRGPSSELILGRNKTYYFDLFSDVKSGAAITDQVDDGITPSVLLKGVGVADGQSYDIFFSGKTIDFAPSPWQ